MNKKAILLHQLNARYGMFGDYEFANGGFHKVRKFKKSDMKVSKKSFQQIYPKPFNKKNAFYRQKRGKK